MPPPHLSLLEGHAPGPDASHRDLDSYSPPACCGFSSAAAEVFHGPLKDTFCVGTLKGGAVALAVGLAYWQCV